MKKLVKLTTTAVSAILLLSMLAIIQPVFASPAGIHVINPNTGDNQFIYSTDVISVGGKFWANITLTDFTDVYTWQMRLTFNATLLHVTQAPYPADHIFAGKTTAPSVPVIDNTAGYVLSGNSLVGEVPGVSGTNARLVQVEFEIMKEPDFGGSVTCNLTFFYGTGGTFYVDSTGTVYNTPADPAPEDGYYEYSWAPPATRPYLEVLPTLTEVAKDATPVIGTVKAEFEVGIYIRNLDKDWLLVAVQMMLKYNTSLLEVMSVTEGPFMQDATWNLYGTFPIVVIEGDHVILGDIIFPNATGEWDQTEFPNGGGLLFTIRFKAILQEEYPWSATTILDLTKLDGREHGVDVYNGYIVFDPDRDATVKIYGYVLGRFIDVYTQWGGEGYGNPSDMFAPQDLVILNATVTYNLDPVQHKLVYFYIISPTGRFKFERTAMTDEYGVATTSFRIPWPCEDYNDVMGIWNVTATVDIAEETVIDTLQFKVGWYIELVELIPKKTDWLKGPPKGTGEDMEFTVVFRSYAVREINGTISVIVYDNLEVPIGIQFDPVSVSGATWCEFKYYNVTVTMPVPSWAYIGPAMAYANCYSGLPWLCGHAMCPEISAAINIVRP